MPMSGWKKSNCVDEYYFTSLGYSGFAAMPGQAARQLGEVELEADGDGWGYNFGLLWQPLDCLSFGVAYRSEIELDFDGDADYQLTTTGQCCLWHEYLQHRC